MKYTRYLFFVILLFLTTNCTHTETKSSLAITEKEITYTAGETTMNGFLAYSEHEEGKRPGILVVHEWWGHNDHARESARKLAKLGYVALAVDMYGEGKQADHPDEAMEFSSQVMGDIDVATDRFEAALRELITHPKVDSGKIGAIGYCFGGSLVLSMANAGLDLDGVAAFHAGLQLPVMPGNQLTSRVLVMNGAEDPLITEDQVENFVGAMERANADFNYIAYENAVHAFTNPGADSLGEQFGLPLAYNAEADSASWAEMKKFFEETFSEEEEGETER